MILAKINGNKIEEIYVSMTETAKPKMMQEGYIEIDEQYADICNTGYPLLYSNGIVEIDTEEIAKREHEENLHLEYDELVSQLSATDYVVIKIAEGVATAEEYADVLNNRATWRVRINEIESEINNG